MMQFYHANKEETRYKGRSYTIGVEVPTKDDLLAIITGSKNKTFSVGYSICSPKDQFTRKIGRETALKRKFESKFNLGAVFFEGERTYFRFDDIESSLSLLFSIHEKSQFVYFISALWR